MFKLGFIFVSCFHLSFSAQLPADIPKCRSEDFACICKRANYFVRQYKGGSASLGIPQIDPYYVNRTVNLSPSGNGPIHLELKVKNLNVTGLASQDFQRAVGFTKDPYKSKFELYGHVPKFEFTGDYTAKGQILIIPIQGSGQFTFTLQDIKGAVKFKPTVHKDKSDGKTYLRIERIKTRLEPSKINVTFSNLFNGNRELEESVNRLINENILELWKELSPPAYAAAEDIMRDILDKIISQYAYEDLYLD